MSDTIECYNCGFTIPTKDAILEPDGDEAYLLCGPMCVAVFNGDTEAYHQIRRLEHADALYDRHVEGQS